MISIPGINIRHPWSELILNKTKVIETRNYSCPIKFVGKPLLLIETGKKNPGMGVGIIIIETSIQYCRKTEYLNDIGKHFVTAESEFFWKDLSKPKYGWKISEVYKLKYNIPVPKNRGYVWTSPIDIPLDSISKPLLKKLCSYIPA